MEIGLTTTIDDVAKLCTRLSFLSLKYTSKSDRQRKKFKESFTEFFNVLGLEHGSDEIWIENMFRLMTPSIDFTRVYSIQEATLGSALKDAFNLSYEQAKKLAEWNKHEYQQSGNFGTIVNEIFRHISIRPYRHHSIDVITGYLDELALLSPWTTMKPKISIPKRSRSAIIKSLFMYQSPESCQWISRIILKNMPGMEWIDVMSAFHPCMVNTYRMYLHY